MTDSANLPPLKIQLGSRFRNSPTSAALVISLICSLLVLVGSPNSYANGTPPSSITYNDSTCDLSGAGYLGDGSQANPYKISDSESLWEVVDCSITASAPAHFELTNNISVTPEVGETLVGVKPIGALGSDSFLSFSGVLDGKSFSVTNLSMDLDGGAGLFGHLENAVIRGMILSGTGISSTGSGLSEALSAGSLASHASGETLIQNVINQVPVSSSNAPAGGLIGWSSGNLKIEGSINLGDVNAGDYAGGFVGQVANNVQILSSINRGEVTGLEYTGGLIGNVAEIATLSASANSGEVSGTDLVGGLLGQAIGAAVVADSANSSTVSGTGQHIGGLVGMSLDPLAIETSMNSGSIQGTKYLGGLVGIAVGTLRIANSQNSAPVSAQGSDVGGLVGQSNLALQVQNSTNSGQVSGNQYVGGLIGYGISTVTITSSQNLASVSARSGNVGGVVGQVISAFRASAVTNSGQVSGSNYVAGLAGYAIGSVNIEQSANLGSISGFGSFVGGFVGQTIGAASYTDSINNGSVRATKFLGMGPTNYVGGFVGYAVNPSSFIRTANLAPVQGSDNYVGGLIGHSNGSFTASQSQNVGPVLGKSFVGGLIGEAIDPATLFGVLHQGSVRAIGDFAGGLFGAAGQLQIDQSQSSGRLEAADYVGGLVGRGNNAATTVSDVIRIGEVVGRLSVGGITGTDTGPASITNYLQVSSISGTGEVDALSGTTSSTVDVASVYISETSLFATSTPVESMKQASTLDGFDFGNTWGFGSCTDNQGFPMLRVLGQISNYNSVACGYIAPTPAPPAPADPLPAGIPVLLPLPAIGQSLVEAIAGEEKLLTGERFDLIRSVSVNGLAATISQLTHTSLVLELPALSAGTYSLDFETINGRITYQGLIRITTGTAIALENSPASEFIVSSLNPKSSWLTKPVLEEIAEVVPGQASIVCIAYNERPGLVARKKALSRAMHACRVAEQQGIETKVFVYGKAPELADTVKILFR